MISSPPPLFLVQTTLGDEAAARLLVSDLIERKLVVCGQIGPQVQSIYPWQGTIEQQGEVVVSLKTTPRALPALKKRLLEKHPYDVPELLVLPVIESHDEYLNWAEKWVESSGRSTHEPNQ